jgi:hypothetical protein
VARVERAARIANLVNDIQKIDEFNLCLREEAIKWCDSLEYIPNFDMTWINVKMEFLKAFAMHQTAMTLCVTMQGLKQGSAESVQLYYNRVTDTFAQMKYATPVMVNTHQGNDATLHFDAVLAPLGIPAIDAPRNYADTFTYVQWSEPNGDVSHDDTVYFFIVYIFFIVSANIILNV